MDENASVLVEKNIVLWTEIWWRIKTIPLWLERRKSENESKPVL